MASKRQSMGSSATLMTTTSSASRRSSSRTAVDSDLASSRRDPLKATTVTSRVAKASERRASATGRALPAESLDSDSRSPSTDENGRLLTKTLPRPRPSIGSPSVSIPRAVITSPSNSTTDGSSGNCPAVSPKHRSGSSSFNPTRPGSRNLALRPLGPEKSSPVGRKAPQAKLTDEAASVPFKRRSSLGSATMPLAGQPKLGLSSVTELGELSPAKPLAGSDRISKRQSLTSLGSSTATRLPRPASIALLRPSMSGNRQSLARQTEEVTRGAALSKVTEEKPVSSEGKAAIRASSFRKSTTAVSQQPTRHPAPKPRISSGGAEDSVSSSGSPAAIRAAAYANLTGSMSLQTPETSASAAYANLSGASPSTVTAISKQLATRMIQKKFVALPTKSQIPVPATAGATPPVRRESKSAVVSSPLKTPTSKRTRTSFLKADRAGSPDLPPTIPIPTLGSAVPSASVAPPVGLQSFPLIDGDEPAPSTPDTPSRSRKTSGQSDIDARLEMSMALMESTLDSPDGVGSLVQTSIGRNTRLSGSGTRKRLSLNETWLPVAMGGVDSPGGSPSPMRAGKGNLSARSASTSVGDTARMRALREESTTRLPSFKNSPGHSPLNPTVPLPAKAISETEARLGLENEKLKQQLAVMTTELFSAAEARKDLEDIVSSHTQREAALNGTVTALSAEMEKREKLRIAEMFEEIVRVCQAELGMIDAERMGLHSARCAMERAQCLLEGVK